MLEKLISVLRLVFWIVLFVFAYKIVGVVFDVILTGFLVYLAFIYKPGTDETD